MSCCCCLQGAGGVPAPFFFGGASQPPQNGANWGGLCPQSWLDMFWPRFCKSKLSTKGRNLVLAPFIKSTATGPKQAFGGPLRGPPKGCWNRFLISHLPAPSGPGAFPTAPPAAPSPRGGASPRAGCWAGGAVTRNAHCGGPLRGPPHFTLHLLAPLQRTLRLVRNVDLISPRGALRPLGAFTEGPQCLRPAGASLQGAPAHASS